MSRSRRCLQERSKIYNSQRLEHVQVGTLLGTLARALPPVSSNYVLVLSEAVEMSNVVRVLTRDKAEVLMTIRAVSFAVIGWWWSG